jgi:hypothetical protein
VQVEVGARMVRGSIGDVCGITIVAPVPESGRPHNNQSSALPDGAGYASLERNTLLEDPLSTLFGCESSFQVRDSIKKNFCQQQAFSELYHDLQDVMMAPVYALVLVLRKGERERVTERERDGIQKPLFPERLKRIITHNTPCN